jgi:hypothetical protein
MSTELTELEVLLSERGVLQADRLLAALPTLEHVQATVAYWDAIRARKTPGLLVSLLRSGKAPMQPHAVEDPTRRATRGRREDVAWALAHGFSERRAPFAALTMQKRRAYGEPVTVAEIRSQLAADYPWLNQTRGDTR